MSEEVRKIRPARWIDPQTGIIQPYSLKRAQGAAILEVLRSLTFCIFREWFAGNVFESSNLFCLFFSWVQLLTQTTSSVVVTNTLCPQEVDNGRYAKSERYLDHVPLKKDRKAVLLITNKLVLCDW